VTHDDTIQKRQLMVDPVAMVREHAVINLYARPKAFQRTVALLLLDHA
jgi:hypothetical protein